MHMLLVIVSSVVMLGTPLDVQTRTLVRRAGHDPLKLPFVAGSGTVPERINTVVFVTLISAAPPTPEGTLVETDDSKWYTSLQFTVPRNDDRLIELELTGETCGAYCEPVNRSFTFDSRTGRSLALTDVLTARGIDIVAERLRAERTRRYRAQIQALSRIKYRDKDLEDRLTFNKECFDFENKHGLILDPTAASYTAKGITARSARCSSHSLRAFDDVGEVSIAVSYGDLTAVMTPYGRAVLTGVGDSAAPDDVFGQTLRGTVGPSAITVVLERPNSDGSFSGHYFYDKDRRPIALRGHRNADGTLQMTESAAAEFSLTLSGTSLAGKLIARGRTLDVRLSF